VARIRKNVEIHEHKNGGKKGCRIGGKKRLGDLKHWKRRGGALIVCKRRAFPKTPYVIVMLLVRNREKKRQGENETSAILERALQARSTKKESRTVRDFVRGSSPVIRGRDQVGDKEAASIQCCREKLFGNNPRRAGVIGRR